MKEREKDTYHEFLEEIRGVIRNSGVYTIEIAKVMDIEAFSASFIGAYELQEALSYLEDGKATVPHQGVARMQETAAGATSHLGHVN